MVDFEEEKGGAVGGGQKESKALRSELDNEIFDFRKYIELDPEGYDPNKIIPNGVVEV